MQASENWFGANLRETRKNKGVTVQRLSDDSGVSQATIKNTESGKSIPKVDIARAFLVGLRAEIDDFLTT